MQLKLPYLGEQKKSKIIPPDLQKYYMALSSHLMRVYKRQEFLVYLPSSWFTHKISSTKL